MVIKAMNRMKQKEAAKPAEPATAPKEQILLDEIRDLLKQQQS